MRLTTSLYQNRFKTIKYDDKFWKKARLKLDELTESESLFQLIKFVTSLKVLAAQEIKFGERGIELVMPKKSLLAEYNTPPLPETKRF